MVWNKYLVLFFILLFLLMLVHFAEPHHHHHHLWLIKHKLKKLLVLKHLKQ